MTLAVILAVSSLLGSGTVSAEALLNPILQEQQIKKSPGPSQQEQEQSSQDSQSKQQPAPEASPAQGSEKPSASEPGNQDVQGSKPDVEKPAEEPSSPEKTVKAERSSRKAKHKKSPPKSSSGPKRVVVRDGSTAEPTTQLSPGMPHDQATHSQQTTTWLLSSTEANLKRASTRTLSSNQQATVQQIKIFMDQASAAMKDGDFQRSRNLAMKAHLLSDDLVKH